VPRGADEPAARQVHLGQQGGGIPGGRGQVRPAEHVDGELPPAGKSAVTTREQ